MDTTLSLSSPSALLSSLSPTKPSSILSREFLGCGHNLRPPGTSNCKNLLRSLRKLKKHQDSPNGSSRFCVKAASADPHSTLFVVAAVAAVSAVSIVLVGQCNKRKSSSEVSVSSNLVLSQLAKDLVSSIIDLQTLVFGRLQTETSLKGSKDAGNKIEVTSDVALDKDSSQQFQKIDLPCDDSLMTTTSESPAANSLPSSDFFCELLEGSGATGLSFPSPVLPESVAVQPLIFATEMSEVQLEKSEHEVESDSMFPALRVKTESNAVLVPTGTACTLINEHSKVNLEHAYVALGQPVREELYTFYGTNQSVVKSPSKLSDLKPLSSYSSRLDHNAFSATKKNTEQKKVHLAAKGSRLTAECVEVKVPLASHKGGSSTKRKDPERVRGSLRGKERRREIPDNSRNVAHINEKHPWPEVQHSYNRFLRDGRLTECVEFLEDMDRKGLLEMNKIYHAKFFQLCKIQKAVKEAFRFTKLIANPTLSTFNMLMSVCANSQDSEGAFKVLQLVREGGLKADCKLYTTLISTCAKSGKVDAMFEGPVKTSHN